MTTVAGLEGILAHASRIARTRRQKTTTAHCVLAMAEQDVEVSALLAAMGAQTDALVLALALCDEPRTNMLELAVERAAKLARETHTRARGMHFLAAMLRDGRSAAYLCLEHVGVPMTRLRDEIASALGLGRDLITPRESELPASLRRLSTPPRTAAASAPRPSAIPRPPALPSPSASPSSAEIARRASELPPPAPIAVPRTARNRPSPRPAPNRRVPASGDPIAVETPFDSLSTPETAPLGPFELDPARFPLLTSMGRNLTAAAAKNEIDPVIGREREIERLVDVLCRRRANNPLLVGAPGVGKTALVEGLAQEIVRAPERSALAGRVVIEVSAGALISGTGVRGALAERLTKLKAEVARSEGRVLLFLDEIHAIVGGAAGPDDLGSELKGALSRGELACIGATTEREYDKHVARDPALARRFTRIDVAEPTPSDAIAILRGLLPSYEQHHAVAFEPDAVRAAVELTVRFVPERHLPDKALAALDLAAARVRRGRGTVVDVAAVARVVSDEAHVPLDRLLVRDAERLLSLERHLESRVVGQRGPLARISEALRKGAAGFRGKRPLGTFLLLGPTGVGKTETAKAVADLLFAGAMTRFDMSELGEPHAVARLFGAPPGYIGHDEGGQLTEAVRKRPYQLVLLDEIEKAHPDVLIALLPLLDEGRLTDGRGRTVDFTQTVIVMTSNLGAAAATSAPRSVGFGGTDASGDLGGPEARALAAARKAMPPELWNRIDEPLWFGRLGEDDVAEIARRMLAGVAQTMEREHRVALRVEESAIAALVRAGGFDAQLGARPMRRTVGRLVEAQLASRVLAGELRAGDRVCLRGEGDRVVISHDDDALAAE